MWTKEPPKKEGYYWVYTHGELTGRKRICPVHAYCSNKDGIVSTVFYDGENFGIDCGLFEEWFSEEISMPAYPVEQACLCTYYKIGSVEKGVRENNPLCQVHNKL